MYEGHRSRRRPGRRLLGVDLGERWVGVAATDDTGVLASPVDTIDIRRSSLDAVIRFAVERDVSAIVVGLPKTMSGSEGFQARRARDQAEALRVMTDLPVIFWDERLTTAMAERIAQRGGRKRRRGAVQPDALAAAILLQSYIDANPYSERPAKRL